MSVEGDRLTVRIRTDLPLKTRLHLQITRPSEAYIWTNFDEPVLIQSIGEVRESTLIARSMSLIKQAQ